MCSDEHGWGWRLLASICSSVLGSANSELYPVVEKEKKTLRCEITVPICHLNWTKQRGGVNVGGVNTLNVQIIFFRNDIVLHCICLSP